MSRRHWSMVMIAVLMSGLALVWRSSAGAASGAAAPIGYTRTLAGIDFHALDARIQTEFVSGSGGGVYAALTSTATGAPPQGTYVEATVNLPVGAEVTAVTFYYWDAGKKGAFPLGTYYFGSYSPSDGGYADALPPASSDFGQRRHTYAFTRSGTPITTVVANRRYVLGAWS